MTDACPDEAISVTRRTPGHNRPQHDCPEVAQDLAHCALYAEIRPRARTCRPPAPREIMPQDPWPRAIIECHGTPWDDRMGCTSFP